MRNNIYVTSLSIITKWSPFVIPNTRIYLRHVRPHNLSIADALFLCVYVCMCVHCTVFTIDIFFTNPSPPIPIPPCLPTHLRDRLRKLHALARANTNEYISVYASHKCLCCVITLWWFFFRRPRVAHKYAHNLPHLQRRHGKQFICSVRVKAHSPVGRSEWNGGGDFI